MSVGLLSSDLVTGTEKDHKVLSFLSEAKGKSLSVDTETNAVIREKRNINDIRDGRGYAIGLSMAYWDGPDIRSIYLPFRHAVGTNLSQSIRLAAKEVIESAPSVVFHNGKFDIVSLATLDINMFGKNWWDTIIMAHLINENWPFSKSLNDCCAAYLGEGFAKVDSPEMKAIATSFGWAYIPPDMMDPYACMDAELTLRLAKVLYQKLVGESEKLLEYWTEQKRPLIETVAVMESRGVRVDVELCNRMVGIGEEAMADYVDMLGGKSPGSPKDMKELLIDTLGLPPIYKERKNGSSTLTFDKAAIAEYEEMLERMDEPAAEYILGYRGWAKAVSSFYRPYVRFLSPDGRLRPSYRHHKDVDEGGTVTGRLSCADPNLQQIPRKSDKPWHGQVKKAFLPADGYTLWEADYSQLELRLGTAYAKDDFLKQVFLEGRDIFTEMSERLGLSRDNTKTFVYSTQYGAGVRRIKNVFRITEVEARNIRENYFATFPGFKRISDRAQELAKTYKKVQLWTGRYRHFMHPAEESHKALNAIIQGGAADIVERQMVRLFREVDQPSNGDCRMLLQVHDSVVFEIKIGMEQKYISMIKDVMEDVRPDFDVKFAVAVKRFGAS